MNPDGRKSEGELEEVKRGETMIKTECVRKKYLQQNKNKTKKQTTRKKIF